MKTEIWCIYVTVTENAFGTDWGSNDFLLLVALFPIIAFLCSGSSKGARTGEVEEGKELPSE